MNQKTRMEVWNKYGHRCAYCGERITYKQMQVDHIWPQSLSDKEHMYVYSYEQDDTQRYTKINKEDYQLNDMRNLNPSCKKCNFYKGNAHLEEFRNKLKTVIQRCRKIYINNIAEKYGIYQYNEWDGKFFFEKYDPTIHLTLEFVEAKPERLTFEEFAYRELSKHGSQRIMKGRKK